MRDTGIKCPWCGRGTVVVHSVKEPWSCREDGDEASDGTRQFPAGIKRKRFVAAPHRWVSCTSCLMTATVEFCKDLLLKRRYIHERTAYAPAVHQGQAWVRRES